MKRGTVYAKRVKRVYAQLKKSDQEPPVEETTNPIDQLILSVLSQETTRANARRAFKKLLDVMIDVNEIRVSSAREIADAINRCVPNPLTCAKRLCTMLNAVFLREHAVNLDVLLPMGKREARRRLEELNGIQPYNVASVMLWSLGGHAVPVNDRLLTALREAELVGPDASVSEVQSFLERHIPPAEARSFCRVMDGFASTSRAPRSKRASSARKATKTRSAGTKVARPKTSRRKGASAPRPRERRA